MSLFKTFEYKIKKHFITYILSIINKFKVRSIDRDQSSIDINMPFSDVYKTFATTAFTRIPVYNSTPDEMLGFVHVKDFLPYTGLEDKRSEFNIKHILRKLIYVPRSTQCINLLNKMRKEATHIAVVLDEYGGTEGIVMIEMLLEEIIGEIKDEHDNEKPETVLVQEIADNVFVIDAKTNIDIVEEQLKIQLKSTQSNDDYETMGGLVLSYLKYIPTEGERFEHESGVQIEVIEADDRRIYKLKVSIKKDGMVK